jgi:hypothetical protein
MVRMEVAVQKIIDIPAINTRPEHLPQCPGSAVKQQEMTPGPDDRRRGSPPQGRNPGSRTDDNYIHDTAPAQAGRCRTSPFMVAHTIRMRRSAFLPLFIIQLEGRPAGRPSGNLIFFLTGNE